MPYNPSSVLLGTSWSAKPMISGLIISYVVGLQNFSCRDDNLDRDGGKLYFGWVGYAF